MASQLFIYVLLLNLCIGAWANHWIQQSSIHRSSLLSKAMWWFQIFLMFTFTRGNDQIWLFFSDGLKPPTRKCFDPIKPTTTCRVVGSTPQSLVILQQNPSYKKAFNKNTPENYHGTRKYRLGKGETSTNHQIFLGWLCLSQPDSTCFHPQKGSQQKKVWSQLSR